MRFCDSGLSELDISLNMKFICINNLEKVDLIKRDYSSLMSLLFVYNFRDVLLAKMLLGCICLAGRIIAL